MFSKKKAATGAAGEKQNGQKAVAKDFSEQKKKEIDSLSAAASSHPEEAKSAGEANLPKEPKRHSPKAQHNASDAVREIWDNAYSGCYYIGTQLMRDFLMVKRDLFRFWQKVSITVPRAWRRFKNRAGRRLEKFSDDLLFPYRIIAKETGILWNRLKARKEKVPEAVSAKEAFHEYYRATERPFNRITNFFAPIIGVAILASVIGYFNGMTFALKVNYNGNTLGYIASESEFYEARNSMLDRLINEAYIPPEETIPALSLAIVDNNELLSQEELVNAIMRSSGNELTSANGFYLEGQFLGAVKDGNEFLLYLDKILNLYRTGEEHEVVQFTKNITLENGVYPTSSVISLATLQNYLRSDERLERTYSAKSGDTLADIAKRYNTTVEELFSLNYELKDYLTDVRIQYLGYDPDAPIEEMAVGGEWANDMVSTMALDVETETPTEEIPADFPIEWLQDSKWSEKSAKEAPAEEETQQPETENTEAVDTVIALENVPMLGGEELLVAKINVNLGIQVTRRETYIGKVAFGTTYVEDNTLPVEYTATISAGISGTEEVVADITYVDGEEVSESVISRTPLTEPVNRKVKIGTLSISEWLGGTGNNFIWPVDGGKFNGSLGSYYGHTGMDIATPDGTTIRASKAGTVTTAMNYGWNSGYGRTVVINHGNGVTTRYAHMSKVTVSVGQYVQQGGVIGYSGNSGNSSGPHCHFEIRINGVIMAPEKYIGYYSNR